MLPDSYILAQHSPAVITNFDKFPLYQHGRQPIVLKRKWQEGKNQKENVIYYQTPAAVLAPTKIAGKNMFKMDYNCEKY